MPRLQRPTTPQTPLSKIVEQATAWLVTKRELKSFEKAEKQLKTELNAAVEAHGTPDEKGHVWLKLPADVRAADEHGSIQVYNALQRQRRASVVMDEDVALKRLEARGLVDECSTSYIQVTDPERAIAVLTEAGLLDGDTGIEIHTRVDEDKVQAAFFQERIDQADYDAIFTQRVTWALLPGRI